MGALPTICHHTPHFGIGCSPSDTQTFLISQNVSKLASPPSRPMPDSLTPPNGCPEVAHVLAVDEHHARLDTGRESMRTADVLRPHVRREPVRDVVGEPEAVGLVVERDQACDRPEDLFLRDAHAVSTPVMTVGRTKWPFATRDGTDAGAPPPAAIVAPSSRASSM